MQSNLGPVILITDWVLFSLSTAVVLLRLATRIWITRNPGWDDLMIALTQVLLQSLRAQNIMLNLTKTFAGCEFCW